MKLVYAAAALALAISPIAALQSAAPAQAAPAVAQAGPPVASPAGWGTDFSKWLCNRYGVSC